ncbi:MAG TPA: hypothetical protein VKB89_19670 [Xanthobacteraceae bacterium]|nr:hypothetical protein [Xanthobacteraceae bacterium]
MNEVASSAALEARRAEKHRAITHNATTITLCEKLQRVAGAQARQPRHRGEQRGKQRRRDQRHQDGWPSGEIEMPDHPMQSYE